MKATKVYHTARFYLDCGLSVDASREALSLDFPDLSPGQLRLTVLLAKPERTRQVQAMLANLGKCVEVCSAQDALRLVQMNRERGASNAEA